jgi:peptide-methionine (S)-S-oxide reductase
MLIEHAVFAAGCFWGVEEMFRNLPGVIATAVGYTGGSLREPTYHDVCSGRTGHAEAVKVSFAPEQISYEELLGVFWQCHDPTTLNRQGPDVGSQYRSAIFYANDAQQKATEESLSQQQASGRYRQPIVTEVTPMTTFWLAEPEHQQYLAKRRS